MKRILVVGSINLDEVHFVKKFPLIGETISAEDVSTHHGGKGANQAIAARRLSTKRIISLFGKVEDSALGVKEREHLKKNDINCKYVLKSKQPTGKATILVSRYENNNMIIVNKGANKDFYAMDIKSLEMAIKENDYILLQLETNNFLVEKALILAKKYHKMTFMNPAPAEQFEIKHLKYIDWIFPNETELELISNDRVNTINDIERTLAKLSKSGLKNAIVTLGENGAYLWSKNLKRHFFTKRVEVVDPTAAGDTFIGAFVGNFADKNNFKSLINFAMDACLLTIQAKGAQSSIPTLKEVEKWRKLN